MTSFGLLPADCPGAQPDLPNIVAPVPGPKSVEWVSELAEVECPAITARRARRSETAGVAADPIVWERAAGANIWDVDGNRYVDLSGAFAVAAVGHAHPTVVEAGRKQLGCLVHGMGDVFPNRWKIELGRRLEQVTPAGLTSSVLCLSGSEAVEAALKTAVMATGKSGVIAFQGAYHGLSYGALAATAYKNRFRQPFYSALNPNVVHAPYPGQDGGPFGADEAGGRLSLSYLDHLIENPATGVQEIGAIIFEPIQGRGGLITPPASWVRGLAQLAKKHGIVLIADEIFTGFGRTGRWFACDHYGIVPDVMCVGKALGGGFPISAAIGRGEVMAKWGQSAGEAIHTSTFLGNPLGCAMALATIDVLESELLVHRSAALGVFIRSHLLALGRAHPERTGPVRGRGMMVGVPLLTRDGEPDTLSSILIMERMLERGYIMLPSGVFGHVLALTPPLVISRKQLTKALTVLDEVVAEVL